MVRTAALIPASFRYRFDSPSHVSLLSVCRIDLDAAPILNLGLDQFEQLSFLGIKNRLVEVRWIGDQEPLAPFGLFIVCDAPAASRSQMADRGKAIMRLGPC